MKNTNSPIDQFIKFILIGSLIFCSAYAVVDIIGSGAKEKPQENRRPSLIAELTTNYVGKRYDPEVAEELIENYGYPESLEGTNNNIWIAYFPKGDFTMWQTKGDYIIKEFEAGRHPR